MVQLPPEFRAALESFSGPLDLLLYLIKKDEVDIFDIPIRRIVEQYQVHLEILSQVDPNACGEFLVTAANLMEIKSKLLLPAEVLPEDEALEDPRIELVRQLLEYKKYKERAILLEKRIDERRRRHERPRVSLGDDESRGADALLSGPLQLGNVTIWDLFTAFHKIQIALGAREPHRVILKERPIEEYIGAVENILREAPRHSANFEGLFSEARDRYEAIGILLAILEMAKQCRLSLHQEETFGTIEVRLHDPEETRALLERAALEAGSGVDPAEKLLLEGEGRAAAAEPIEEGEAAPGGTGPS
ncbi:MAG TPA: segregation/condensation protein A [Planctomycetota bacterium]|nr:segregation/condensation protein A [Planctomycetota bacterium]